MENALFKVSLQIILKNKIGKILILNQDGKWLLPGGRIQKDEKWDNALSREIKEETGIDDFQIEKILDVRTTDDNDQFIITFFGHAEKTEVILSSEHQDFQWIDIKELDLYKFWHPSIKERIIASTHKSDTVDVRHRVSDI